VIRFLSKPKSFGRRFPICLFAMMAMFSVPAMAQKITAPGFKSELLFKVPEIEHPSSVVCDDEGNLFVGEDPMDMRGPATKEFDRIIYFRWSAGEEKPRRTVFAENLSAVFGLVWHDGWLYVLHAPHYTRFRDKDGDGIAEIREELADGFGPPAGIFGFNDHIVTGTRMGMDGYIYVSVGDKGIQKATGSDGSTITLEGGGVVRMRPNGTKLEVVSSGTRNHLDVAMDSLDNIFTYDNTDDGLGWWTRLTHHVMTGYYGYPFDYHPHPERHLPRISEHGGGSPCGAVSYREAAWPEQYRDAAFFCEWGKGKVQCFHFQKKGATFDAKIEDFMINDGSGEFRPVDACVSPDGKYMYVADWNYGGWVNPQVAGRVFRVSYVGSDVPAEPPRAKDTDPLASQLKSLAHPAFSERTRAQHQMARLGKTAVEPLSQLIADKNAPKSGKIHAIWSLAEIADDHKDFDPTSAWLGALADADPDVRGQLARALGERPTAAAIDPLTKLLGDTDPSVRMRAAIALGRTGDPRVASFLAATANDSDPFARFTKIQALRKIGNWSDVSHALAEAKTTEDRDALLLSATGIYDKGAVDLLARWVNGSADPKDRAKAIELLAEVGLKSEPYMTGWWGTRPAAQGPTRPKVKPWEGSEVVTRALDDALRAKETELRVAAARAFRTSQADKVLPKLHELATKDPSAEVRREVFSTLATLHRPESIPILAAVCRDRSADVGIRSQAATSLVELGSVEGSELVPKTLVELVQSKETPDEVALIALGGLTKFPIPSAKEAIESKLHDARPAVRAQAIDTFASVGGNGASAKIATLLKDADPTVRLAAVKQLGKLAVTNTIPALIEAAADPSVQQDAIISLSRMPDVRALSLYLSGLTDRSQDVRTASQQALVDIREIASERISELSRRGELSDRTRNALFVVYAAPKPFLRWHIIGSWTKPAVPEFDASAAPDFSKRMNEGEKHHQWEEIRAATASGRVDPGSLLKPTDQCWALAFTTFEVATAGKQIFQVGSDDQMAVWIDGKKVYEFNENRGWSENQHTFDLKLEPGTHKLYVLAGNDGGPWSFSVRTSPAKPTADFLVAKKGTGGPDLASYAEHARKNPGKAARGKELFEDPKGIGCIKCHAVGGKGKILAGPDLLGVGAKYPREELIRSVLEPSSRLLSGYEMNVVATADGQIIQGVIKSDTPERLELVDAKGNVISLAKDEIDEQKKSDVSMMPNGLADGMTPEDFADIIAYLESLR